MTYDNDKHSGVNERVNLDDKPWVPSPGDLTGSGQPVVDGIVPTPRPDTKPGELNNELDRLKDGLKDVKTPQGPDGSLD